MSEENHDRQFKGTWAFATLHDLVEKGKLSAVAAWLAMVIDSLSHTDRGCYASNKFLGMKIHKSEVRIRAILRKLEDAGVLISKWEGDERRMWIDYNCKSIDNKRCVNYKKDIRPVENNLSQAVENKRLKTTGKYIKNFSIKEGVEGPPPEPKPLICKEDITKIIDLTEPTMEPRKVIKYQPRKKQIIKFQPFLYKSAKDLREILTEVAIPSRVVSGNDQSWASELNRLYISLNKDEQRISKVLKWLRKRINEEDIPKPSDVYQFCSPKLFNWYEDIMKKEKKQRDNGFQRNGEIDESLIW